MLYTPFDLGCGNMKTCQKKFRANSSGQLLIVAALAIAILISSTTIYVYEVSKETSSQDYSSISNFILAIKQSARNAMISALSNVSNGGEKTVLAANLNEFSQVLRSLSYFGTYHLVFTLFNGSNYDEGILLFWNTSDAGVSSAYANFNLKIYSMAENFTFDYDANVTTAITISGYYTRLAGDEKQINLTCSVYNEGKPALARNLTFYYESLGSWIPVNSSNNLSIKDYGNGTYRISFTVLVPSDSIQVSARVHDLRNVFVRANTTCYEA
ncbi:hypothetical protein HXY32_03500 [Candidatus Bathyarchaeota archaeon]|nr:hypothetical protein [Candidatus Bathyarchaeota archaeon]